MLPNFPRADTDIVTRRSNERSHDDLDSIIAHYKRVSAAEKKLACTIDQVSADHQDNEPPSVLHGPYNPTD